MNKKVENLARKLRHEHMTRNEMKRYLKGDDEQVGSVIKFFREHFDLKQEGRGRGCHFYIRSNFNDNNQYVISPGTKRERHYRWAALSDTHFGTKHTDVDGLEACLGEVVKEGVEHVYFSGDLCDGTRVYKGQINNLSAFTQEDQVAEAVKTLSQFPLHYRMIGGNHDYSWEEQGAPNPVKDACSELDKAEYLGATRADVMIGGVLMRLVHGAGGNAYAKCFDEETEVLTRQGFVPHYCIGMNTEIGTLDEEGRLVWQKPTSIIKQRFKGDMVRFKSRTVDLLVTPNHRMMVKRTESKLWKQSAKLMPKKSHPRVNRGWQEKTADWLSKNHKRQKWCFKKDFVWKGKDLPEGVSFDMLLLMGWYVTEGYIARTPNKQQRVVICQSKKANPENHKEIQDLFYRLFGVRNGGKRDVSYSDDKICDWLVENCREYSFGKCLPSWVKELDTHYLLSLIDVMLKGDGWNIGKNSFGYKSHSSLLLKDFYEICLKAGYVPTLNEKNDTVTVASEQTEPSITNKPTKESYDGVVWCVNVPNETLLARRNGRAVWTYNSYPGQTYLRNVFEGGQDYGIWFGGDVVPLQLLQIGHYHTKLNYNAYGVEVIHPGNFQKGNDFTERRGLRGPRGLYLIDMWAKEGLMTQLQVKFVFSPTNHARS